jgi:putative membrane protein
VTTEIIPLLPPLQAILNTIAASFIASGYLFIRNQNKAAHKKCMISALVISSLFLASYLYYHLQVGYQPFKGEGLIRPLYFLILITHVTLAAISVPLILTTVWLAIKQHTTTHRKLARWTLPIWLYVSITGVFIYIMAFHIYAI